MRRKPNDDDALKVRLYAALTRHIGEERALDMGQLYQEVYEREYHHKINGTRALRKLITELRYEGVAIGSVSSRNQGGYYLIRSGSELGDYIARLQRRGLKALSMAARIKNLSLPELLGQLRINMEGKDVN